MNFNKASAFLAFLLASAKQVGAQVRARNLEAPALIDICVFDKEASAWIKKQVPSKAIENNPTFDVDVAPGEAVPGDEGKTFDDDCVPEVAGLTCTYSCCAGDPGNCGDKTCVEIVTQTGCDSCDGKSSACKSAANTYCYQNYGIPGGCFGLTSQSFAVGEVCTFRRERNRLLADASYNPTPEEAFEVAQEADGDIDAGFVLKEKVLTPDECAKLMVYIDENEGVHYRSNDEDKVIMARHESPLESIIGIERTKELYKFFKDNSNGAPITQVWLRRINGSDTFMGLHTDKMPYQMKIALNDNFDEGDVLIVDREGATHLQLEAGDAYLHDNRLVHGHMPFTGAKYIIYLISDPNPRVGLDLAQAALAH